MKSPEEITAAIWRLIDVADYADGQSRKELVEGLHRIAVASLEALAVAEDKAPDEVKALCRSSTRWPQLITPMNDSEAERRSDFIRAQLGQDAGFDGTKAQRPGSDASFSLRRFNVLEAERRRHLWENLSDGARAEFDSTAKDGQTPEECHAAFKATNYPEWERQVDPCEGSTGTRHIDLRWTYAAGLLGPLTKENTGEWAEAATLYLESLSPEGDLMRCPLVPQVVIDPEGLRAATSKATKREQRAAEESARKATRRELKKKLAKGFQGIARES